MSMLLEYSYTREARQTSREATVALTFLGSIIFGLFYFLGRPLARRLFAAWPLSGAPAGLILGYLLFTWLTWLLMHAKTGMSTPLAWSLLLISVIVANAVDAIIVKTKNILPSRDELLNLLAVVLAFWALSSLYVELRAYNADLNSTEKFPDLAFVMSAFKALSLPPLDPFASGETINYYYLGHFQAALMSHFTSQLPYAYFHYQVGNIFAMSALILFSVGYFFFQQICGTTNRFLPVVAGLLSVFFGILSGNLQPIFERVIMGDENYFYPTATRYIDNVIHEFPYYSFLVGDLHGHLMNLPNAVLAFGLCLLFYNHVKTSNWRLREFTRGSALLVTVTLAFSAGSSYLINAWDILTTLLLAGFAMLAVALERDELFTTRALKFMTALSAALVVAAILFYLPYWLTFAPPAQGIGFVPPAKSSPFGQLMLIWGVHLPFAVLFLWLSKNSFGRAAVALGLILIVLMEFFYMRDIYPTHFRANTVFKIGFQIWLWFSIVSAAAITFIYLSDLSLRRSRRLTLSLLAGLLIGAGGFYTLLAVDQALLHFRAKYDLDGRDFLRRTAPEDVALIDYINEKLPAQPRILEASGESFTEYGRVAAFTGSPTIMQWFVHEWLWRGSYNLPLRPASQLSRQGYVDTVAARVEDVRLFYEAADAASAAHILDKYDVEYFVIGRKERAKYAAMKEDILATLGEVVFSEGQVRLFRVKHGAE